MTSPSPARPAPAPMPVRLLTPRDLPSVLAVQRECYRRELQERGAAFRSKLKLFPRGCLTLDRPGPLEAYVLCLPWRSGEPLPLDAPSLALPRRPDCLYIHDLAVMPALRGSGAAGALLGAVSGLAAELGCRRFALVAVQGSRPFWERRGFQVTRRLDYVPGVEAAYMVLEA